MLTKLPRLGSCHGVQGRMNIISANSAAGAEYVTVLTGTEGFSFCTEEQSVACVAASFQHWLICSRVCTEEQSTQHVAASFQLWRKGGLPANWSHF